MTDCPPSRFYVEAGARGRKVTLYEFGRDTSVDVRERWDQGTLTHVHDDFHQASDQWSALLAELTISTTLFTTFCIRASLLMLA